MSNEELAQQLIALPLPERVDLAQALWQSINEGVGPDAAEEERDAVQRASRRDQELTSGTVDGRTHPQVIEAARRVLGCD